jgi:hypothetical protein
MSTPKISGPGFYPEGDYVGQSLIAPCSFEGQRQGGLAQVWRYQTGRSLSGRLLYTNLVETIRWQTLQVIDGAGVIVSAVPLDHVGGHITKLNRTSAPMTQGRHF